MWGRQQAEWLWLSDLVVCCGCSRSLVLHSRQQGQPKKQKEDRVQSESNSNTDHATALQLSLDILKMSCIVFKFALNYRI